MTSDHSPCFFQTKWHKPFLITISIFDNHGNGKYPRFWCLKIRRQWHKALWLAYMMWNHLILIIFMGEWLKNFSGRPDNQVTILKDTAPLYSFALATIILRGFFLPFTSLRYKRIIIIIIIIIIISCSSDPFVLEVTLQTTLTLQCNYLYVNCAFLSFFFHISLWQAFFFKHWFRWSSRLEDLSFSTITNKKFIIFPMEEFCCITV